MTGIDPDTLRAALAQRVLRALLDSPHEPFGGDMALWIADALTPVLADTERAAEARGAARVVAAVEEWHRETPAGICEADSQKYPCPTIGLARAALRETGDQT